MDGCPAARLFCSRLRLGSASADGQDLDVVDDDVVGDLLWVSAVRRYRCAQLEG